MRVWLEDNPLSHNQESTPLRGTETEALTAERPGLIRPVCVRGLELETPAGKISPDSSINEQQGGVSWPSIRCNCTMNRPGRWPVIEMGRRSSLKSTVQCIARLLLIAVCCSLLPLESAYSEELRLQSLSLRGRISGATLLGEQQPEQFQGYDLAAHFALPWQRYSPAGWGIGTRLMASAGLLRGAGDTGLIVSLIPGLALGSADGRWSLDAGAGVALLSRSRFGIQDFGGPFQFALTLGASFPVYQQVGLSYRFVHYSDAGVNGDNTIGADFHMLEFSWRL